MTRILVVGTDAADARHGEHEVLFRTWDDYGPVNPPVVFHTPTIETPPEPRRERRPYVPLRDVDALVLILEGPDAQATRGIEFSLRGIELGAVPELTTKGFCTVVVGGPSGKGASTSALSSMGLAPVDWSFAHGEAVTASEHGKRFARYLASVKAYSWAVGELSLDAAKSPPAEGYRARTWEFARVVLGESRHGQPVAAKYLLESFKVERRTVGRVDVRRHGWVYFLPPSELPALDAATLVLEAVFGVVAESAAPAWVDARAVPGQQTLERQIEEVDRALEDLRARRVRLAEERSRAREPLRLLYESKRALEPVVWDVLEALGAQVERPTSGVNSEDGWIACVVDGTERHGVLEIKSTEKRNLPELPIRQAVDWREKSIEERGRDHKAIVVGTADVGTAPDQRGDPFSHSFRKNAERNRVAVVRCEDLYRAYEIHAEGRLDRQAFFRKLFDSEGVVDFGGVLE